MGKPTDTTAKPAKKEIRRPLKPRDIRFIKAKAKNPDIPDYQAAMIATGSTNPKAASVQAVRMLENVSLREALNEALVKQGFSIDEGAKALVNALQAKKTYVADGELHESDIADHSIRVNATKTIFAFLQDKSDGNTTTNVFNFNQGTQNFVKPGGGEQ